MPPDRKPDAPRPPSQRSKITNGTRTFLPDARSLSAEARRLRDLMDIYQAEIAGGVTAGQRALVKLAATLALHVEQMQAAQTRGETANTDDLIATGNLLIRTLDKLGLAQGWTREPEAPDPLEYAREHGGGS